MDIYISQGWLINAIKDRNAVRTNPDPIISLIQKNECQEILQLIESAPAADVAPVVHGRWDSSCRYELADGSLAIRLAIRCDQCGCSLRAYEWVRFKWNYCPVCGAKMDGKEPGHG